MARVGSCDDPDTQVLLDNGIMGIVFRTSTPSMKRGARSIAQEIPPIGRRSVSGSLYDVRFTRRIHRRQFAINDNTLVACMIETQEGLDNVEAIAAVEGLTLCTWAPTI